MKKNSGVITNLSPLEAREKNPMGEKPYSRDFRSSEEDSYYNHVNYWEQAEAALKTYMVVDDEAEEMANEIYPSIEGRRHHAFVKGYNKAKEKYPFTEEDMRNCFKDAYGLGQSFSANNLEWHFQTYLESLSPYKVGDEVEIEIINERECKIVKPVSEKESFEDFQRARENEECGHSDH